MRNLSPRKAAVIHATAGTLISFIGMMRIYYVFDSIDFDLPGYLPEKSKAYRFSIYLGLSIFTDMILPFLMVISMSLLSLKIIWVAWKRRKQKPGIRVVPVNDTVAQIPLVSDLQQNCGGKAPKNNMFHTAVESFQEGKR